MNILLIIGCILFAMVAFFVLYRALKVKQQNRKLNTLRYSRIKSLADQLENNALVTRDEVS
jgi:predicted RNase H-like nuclease